MTDRTTQPQVEGLFDAATWTVTYLVHQGPGTACAIIDPVLDYDPKSGRTRHTSADRAIARVQELGLSVAWILETHAHADHLSAAPYLKARLGGRTAIGANITTVQSVFKGLFNLEPGFRTDGSQFDRLLQVHCLLPVSSATCCPSQHPSHQPAQPVAHAQARKHKTHRTQNTYTIIGVL